MQGMVRSMRDPRRRFMFGYTIENSHMELWFCDRTQVLVSSAIDWISVSLSQTDTTDMLIVADDPVQDHLSIVRFFSALLFAEPFELGWDTTIAFRKDRNGDSQYDITIEDAGGKRTVYRTLELVSYTRSELEMGKATRIWRAVELRGGSPHGDPVILKDVWRHEELSREGDTLEAIRQSESSPAIQRLLSRRLLTVLHHGDVIIRTEAGRNAHVDRTRLHTDNVVCFRRNQPLVDPRFASPHAQREPHFIPPDGRRMLLGSRVHYRIVFKEVCTPLTNKPLDTVLTALADTCEGTEPL